MSIVDDIYCAIANKNEKSWVRYHLGASQIGAPCKRAVWYALHWCTVPSSATDGRLLRLFDTGRLEEERIIANLRDVGVVIDTTQACFCDDEYPMISGSCDGIAHGFSEYPDEQILLEFKTSNTKSFKSLREKGIKEEKYQHYVQINLYLLWSGLKRALYIVTCKETDELYAEWVEFDADVANAELVKAKEILLSQKLHARCETAKSEESMPCRFCDYKGICWLKDLPMANCRTCLHCAYNPSTKKFDCCLGNCFADTPEIALDCHRYNPFVLSWMIADISDDCKDFVFVSPYGGRYDTIKIKSIDFKTVLEEEKETFDKFKR